MRAFHGLLCLLVFGCATAPSVGGALRAGAAKVKITPTGPVMLAGYASRNKPSEGVAADLYARALAIDDGASKTVIVAADIIGFGPVIGRALKAEAKARFGLPEDRLLLIGSHTHSGPVISERALVDHPDQVKARDAYVEGLRAKILEAIGGALEATAPATLEMTRGEARIGTYRRVKKPDGTWGFGLDPDGITDPDLPLMKVLRSDGSPLAVFFTYACHCTSVRNNNDGFYLVHPDWAVCCSKLEEKMPGTQVMFLTGCGADIDPGPKGALAVAEKNGQSMLEALEKTLRDGPFRPVRGPVVANLRRIDLPLEKPERAAFEKMAGSPRPGEVRFAKEQLAKMEAGTLPTSIDFPIQTLTFGSDLRMISLGGETCVEYALRLKKELGVEKTWVTGYSNEVMCYIPSERVLRENGYESGWSLATGRGIATSQMSGSGWPTPFALGLEDRIVGAAKGMLGTYRAGASRMKITPEKPGWLTGYGSRNRPADGTALDLHARALALEDPTGQKAVIVSAEILGFPPSMSRWIRDEAKKRYGLADEQILLNASHTHAGPAVPERPSMEVFHGFGEAEAKTVREYAEWLRGAVVDLMGKALAALEPAKLTFSRAKATYGSNRRLPRENNVPALADNPKGVTDPDVPVLEVESKDGRTRAVVFTYACHCTTLGGDWYRYHGDHAGVASLEIERAIPGATALFVNGCSGDLNPMPRGKVEQAEQHGKALAAAVTGALGTPSSRTVSGSLRMRYRTIDLPLEPAPARELVEKQTGSKNVYRARHAKETLRLMEVGKLPAAVPFPILVWDFGGDLTLVALSGETCVEYALRIKKELGEERTWVAGYSNEVACYIPSEKVLSEGGYEAGWDLEFKRTLASGSIMYYGWAVPFAPGIEERILKAVHETVGR